MTKQQWRIVVISTAAVAFSVTAGLEPPLRNLVNFAKAGTSFIAKQLCSGVLMAGMDPDQMLKEDLADGQGMIHTQIEPSAGRVKASSLFVLKQFRTVNGAAHGASTANQCPEHSAKTSLAQAIPSPMDPPGPDRHSSARAT